MTERARTFSSHAPDGTKYYGFDVATSGRACAAAGLPSRAVAADLGRQWKELLVRPDAGTDPWRADRERLVDLTQVMGRPATSADQTAPSAQAAR